MKVLHVHSGNLYGGVETFLVTLARCRNLTPSMEMSVALSFDGQIAAELRAEGVATHLLGEVRLRRPDLAWRARQRLSLLLARERFDVVVCHQAWPHAIFGPAVKSAGVPLVSWVHMQQHRRHWLERLAWRVEPDRIVCNSRFTASTLPPTKARIETIYSPVMQGDPATREPRARVRERLQTSDGDTVIIQVSRMEAPKGQAVCIAALAQLRDQPAWTCWQVGGAQREAETGYLESLRASAERLGVSSRVRFLGQRSDVADLLAAADIYCQPNLEPEGFGLSFVEALAAGLPVVTTGIGGALEIVDDTCGALVPAGDAPALSTALGRLLQDRAERDRLGSAGRRRAQALCDPLAQMRRIADALEDVSCKHPVH